jgi:predicted HTH domain antitoxin
MLSILDYIRDTDTLFILSYSFVNDDPFEALNFKKELDKRKICIHSIMENTLKNSKAINDLTFNIFINLFEYSKFILDNRIKN